MKGWKDNIRKNRFIRWLLLLSNWLFQGMLHSSKTELIFKVLLEIALFSISFLIVKSIISFLLLQISFAFIISHTINWLITTNFNNIFIHRLYLKKLDKALLFEYLFDLQHRLDSQDWLLYAATFGSVSRGTLIDSSDLDISFVRKPGLNCALKSIWFIFKERKTADIKGVPLEAYINDKPAESIKRFKAEETAVVISDPKNEIPKYYRKQLTIIEAKELSAI